MASHSLSKLAQIDKAARTAKPVVAAPPRRDEALSAEASALPPHIIRCTEPRKLNAQTTIFRCPAWADLPSKAWHLGVRRDGAALPSLGLARYPFYLFGKSPACDYALEHPSVSTVHAALVFNKQHECFVLVDLGSTNGSRVNGKLVERQKPVPVPAGSVIQFGYSTRQYEVCTGPAERQGATEETAAEAVVVPPAHDGASTAETAEGSSKRDREETAKVPAPSVKAQRVETAEPASDVASVAARSDINAAVTSTTATATASTAAGAAPALAEEEAPAEEPSKLDRVHLYHLVIKHKDVDNAVSRAERNKGEAITRSKQDAFEIARFVLKAHRDGDGEGDELPGGGFDRWTVEEFIEAIEAYSEMATSKKRKAAGDLGMVERGAYSDEFDRAAFALRREEVSKPVETPLGIHLIYRCD